MAKNIWTSHLYVSVEYMIPKIIGTNMFLDCFYYSGKAFYKTWNLAARICSHSTAKLRSLQRCWVGLKALCRPVKFFYSKTFFMDAALCNRTCSCRRGSFTKLLPQCWKPKPKPPDQNVCWQGSPLGHTVNYSWKTTHLKLIFCLF